MKTISKFSGRSHDGASLLDKRMPHWHRRINAERLDIGNCQNCVLGQLFSRYDIGLQRLNITNQEAVTLGVYAGVRQRRKRKNRYVSLTSEWRARIAERLEADKKTAALPKLRKNAKRTLAVAVAMAISIAFFVIP